jgi:origin recognition complex subunit 5
MRTLRLPHAYVCCIECGSPRRIFESVLMQFSGHKPRASNGYSVFTECSDLPSFVSHLQGLESLCRPGTGAGNTHFIILDNAERLRQFESHFFCALLRLDMLSGANICTILISSSNADHFQHVLCTRPVLRVPFYEYPMDVMEKILLRDSVHQHFADSNVTEAQIHELHSRFVRLLLDIWWHNCSRNVSALR